MSPQVGRRYIVLWNAGDLLRSVICQADHYRSQIGGLSRDLVICCHLSPKLPLSGGRSCVALCWSGSWQYSHPTVDAENESKLNTVPLVNEDQVISRP
jgi:hypothetical protein